MSEKKVKLSVLGFSFNQTQSGTYGLVLAEEGGLRRLMIVVGTPEAQSIAFILHDTQPPRPLTHDLLQTILAEFDILLKEVFIYKYQNGIFFSELVLVNSGNELVSVDSRTSDAIALALRTGTPIYTTEDIMQELAVVFDESAAKENEEEFFDSDFYDEKKNTSDYSDLAKKDLEVMLREAIEGEDYELASILRDEIKKKSKSE